MTESTGKTGRGVTLEIGDGESPESFVAVANVTSISPSGRDSEEIDFTHLGSTGGFREFRQGFKDPGQLNVDYHFSPDEPSHTAILDQWLSGVVFSWRINFAGAGWSWYLQGEGFVKNPGDLSINVNDPIQGTSTIRVTGPTQFVAQ